MIFCNICDRKKRFSLFDLNLAFYRTRVNWVFKGFRDFKPYMTLLLLILKKTLIRTSRFSFVSELLKMQWGNFANLLFMWNCGEPTFWKCQLLFTGYQTGQKSDLINDPPLGFSLFWKESGEVNSEWCRFLMTFSDTDDPTVDS